MIRFECDYTEGCVESVMKKLLETNYEQTVGYGTDYHCENARKLIKEMCEDSSVDVHFLVGGTQANATVIASVLRPHEGVISAESGHINGHETGAVEATGHKILVIPSKEGKISASDVKERIEAHLSDPAIEHLVKPGMVYISFPTEDGTLYSKKELEELSLVCREYEIPLFLDGARLGYGLASHKNDLTMADIARLTDAFYIGGTKCGALMGEAVVITNGKYKKDFRYHIKQRGGMLAKGRLLGIQFEGLLENGNYIRECQRAHNLAMRIKEALINKGYCFKIETFTNQLFPIFPDEKLKELQEKYSFCFIEKVSENETCVRICTSVLTREENVESLINDL